MNFEVHDWEQLEIVSVADFFPVAMLHFTIGFIK